MAAFLLEGTDGLVYATDVHDGPTPARRAHLHGLRVVSMTAELDPTDDFDAEYEPRTEPLPPAVLAAMWKATKEAAARIEARPKLPCPGRLDD